ncbi:MAG: hypothetical protein HY275_05465 [Gemmatimonadetes bacterium]|nr:hypothetical protein [Gemmatimonadota bacterium]
MSGADDTMGPVAARLGPSDADAGNKRPTLWIALAVIAIALAGALAGVATDRALHAHGPRGGRGFGGPRGPFRGRWTRS